MSELENCMETLIFVFQRYAEEDGDKQFLNKKELKHLIETELPNFLKNQKDPKTVDRIMHDLDLNRDQKLDFEEFFPLVAGLSIACEKCFRLQKKKTKK